MDLLAVESVAGALSYGLLGHLFAGERDQCLATALSTEVVQNENGVGLKLQGRQNQTVSSCSDANKTSGEAHTPQNERKNCH